MTRSSPWRDKRKFQYFSNIRDDLGDAMYALSVLQSLEDDVIPFEMYEISESEIREDLTTAIETLESLEEAASGSGAARVEHIQLVDELELTAEDLRTIQIALTQSRDEFTHLDEFSKVYADLRSLEQAVREKMRQYSSR